VPTQGECPRAEGLSCSDSFRNVVAKAQAANHASVKVNSTGVISNGTKMTKSFHRDRVAHRMQAAAEKLVI